jgi:hypothetical protein
VGVVSWLRRVLVGTPEDDGDERELVYLATASLY